MDGNRIISKEEAFFSPSYASFHFFLYSRDDALWSVISDARYHDELDRHGYYQEEEVVVVRTVSEFSEISVKLNVVRFLEHLQSCDKEVDTKISVKYGFLGIHDPSGGEVIRWQVPNGQYQARISYFGQNEVQNDGSSSDSYLIELESLGPN